MSTAAGPVQKLGALLSRDLRGVLRDPLLLMLTFYGIALAGVARLVVPLLPAPALYLYLAPAAPLIGVGLAGSVFGLLIVEEREARTWLLLRALPVSERSLHGYLFLLTTGIALCAAVGGALVYGHPVARPATLLGGLAVTALGAPLMTFFLGSLASNKIEAMALGKLVNLPASAALLAFFVPAPWYVLLWWSPYYWTYVALLRGYAGDAGLAAAPLVNPPVSDAVALAIAAAMFLAGCLVFARRFRAVTT